MAFRKAVVPVWMSKSSENSNKRYSAYKELDKLYLNTRISWTAKNRILDRWESPEKAVQTIKNDPYSLIEEIYGIGFTIADAIAKNLNIAHTSEKRIQAGIQHVLRDRIQMFGHTCVPVDYLVKDAAFILDLKLDLVEPEIDKLIEGLKIIKDNNMISNHFYHKAEKEIADKLLGILKHTNTLEYQSPDARTLMRDQMEAIYRVIDNNVFILTGAPGTGKTYTIKAIIDMYKGASIAMAAPTGKAAKRMIEQTGQHASTIHRLLGPYFNKMTGGFEFKHNSFNPMEYQIIIIDESSMLSTWLMYKLLDAVEENTKLIFVGDTYQLPPVGAGYILGDMLNSGIIPSVELNIIKRQDPGLIITNCHRIKDGKDIISAKGKDKDFFFIESNSTYDMKEKILEFMDHKIKEKFPEVDILKDVQIVAPLREKTLCSCKSLNEEIQKTLNPNPYITKCRFKVGDKVIQTKNNYEMGIINGDIGYIQSIDMSNKAMVIQFEAPDRMITIDAWKNELQLAYAITCHKFQGSENKIILIPIHKSFGSLIMQRNWIYTAISRAQDVCVLIGQRAEIPKIIDRDYQIQRNTHLERFLREKS
ncbi:hypothetical protein LCGC14_0359250 [marine sediment metagenome]|uniref:AAA+ ATPase domain-containing protein n=1 Tax=marine sediment metagenome TaxID=412755 RepID=A0A0F9T8G2_9ZZZZ